MTRQDDAIRFGGRALAERLLLAFITDYTSANGGVSPTVREMGAAIGVSSTGRVQAMIEQLERNGKIRRVPGRWRAIEVIAPAPPKPRSRAVPILRELPFPANNLRASTWGR